MSFEKVGVDGGDGLEEMNENVLLWDGSSAFVMECRVDVTSFFYDQPASFLLTLPWDIQVSHEEYHKHGLTNSPRYLFITLRVR